MSTAREKNKELMTLAAIKQPKFKSVEALQALVDDYFKECEGHMLMDPATNFPVVHPKTCLPIIVDVRPPTMSGLALHLGFSSREGLLRYAGKKEFLDVIVRAKSRIEQCFEERLFDKEGANGAKFALQNNFKGWQESAKVAAQEAANSAVRIVCDFPRPTQVKTEATVPVAPEDVLPDPDDALLNPAGRVKGTNPDEEDIADV